MRIFDANSPLMEGLSKISDLVVLNLLVLLCCIPVITAGAALTGMHYVLLKMARNEEGYIARSYFKSFKENAAAGSVSLSPDCGRYICLYDVSLCISAAFPLSEHGDRDTPKCDGAGGSRFSDYDRNDCGNIFPSCGGMVFQTGFPSAPSLRIFGSRLHMRSAIQPCIQKDRE